MKFIHCADIHLGSKMNRLPQEKAEERRLEVLATFNRLIDYANAHKISVIVLAGDVFDSDRPVKKDKEFFYSAVKRNPQIDFLYLRGNHDVQESYTETPKNLKSFNGEWTSYAYGGVVFTGLEICAENSTSMYSTLNLERDKFNVVILHGDEGSGAGKINTVKLRDKNIDYLALGHIHSYSSNKLDGRGVWCYSGCLEGRGFDEAGKKGFVTVDTDNGVTVNFVPFARREIVERDVELTGTSDLYTALEKIKECGLTPDNMFRLNLTGEIDYDNSSLADDVKKQLEGSCYFLSVKDKTLRRFNIDDYKYDLSLKGEFVREVLSSELSDEEKQRVIYAGFKALAGRGEEL